MKLRCGFVDHAFGGWLVFAGLSLRILEDYRWQCDIDTFWISMTA